MNLPQSYIWPADRVRAWTAAMDAFAAAGSIAVAAKNERELQTGTARALVGGFADWSFVDLSPSSAQSRSVAAAAERDPDTAAALATVQARSCPVIASAMDQRTPLVQAIMADPADLGALPDGRLVSAAVDAGSCAVAPVTVNGVARGAVTIVRSRSRPNITFMELSVLAHIADLAAGAIMRLQAAQRPANGALTR
jgi:GAF domain-containing protein